MPKKKLKKQINLKKSASERQILVMSNGFSLWSLGDGVLSKWWQKSSLKRLQ